MYIYIHHAIINKVNAKAVGPYCMLFYKHLTLHMRSNFIHMQFDITKIFIVKVNSKIEIKAAAK